MVWDANGVAVSRSGHPVHHHDCGLPVGKRKGRWNPACRCLFSALADSLLHRILSCLTIPERAAASLISSRWNHVVPSATSLWATIAFEETDVRGVEGHDVLRVLSLPRYGPKVTSFSVAKFRSIEAGDVAVADGEGVAGAGTVSPAPISSCSAGMGRREGEGTPVPCLPSAATVSVTKSTIPAAFLASLFAGTTSALTSVRLDATSEVNGSVLAALSLRGSGVEVLSLAG